jgi:sialate O-acetylesterase
MINCTKILLKFSILISLLVLTSNIKANVSISYPIADSMVIQRNMRVPIWGTAASGENIQVTFNNQIKTTTTGTNGKWKIVLDSMSAAGPLTMTIKGNNTITVKDLYVGEVWNCAGQSNMDLRLNDYVSNSYNATYADTIKNARNPLLRYIDIRYTSLNKNVGWHAITPSTAGGCSTTAYFYGKILQKRLGCAVGLVVTAVGGTYIERWFDPATLASNPGMVLPSGFTTPGDMYNSFVAPIIPFAIKGTICMLGEQNAGDSLTAHLYGKRFEMLINGWRTSWGQGDFPFYYGQLTMYNPPAAVDTIGLYLKVREGQRCAQKVVNTGMTVNVDLSSSQWHFANKYEAGRRLALQALSKTYGLTGFENSGPEYNTFGIQGSKMRVLFDHAGSGLKTNDGNAPTCFYIAGPDKKWYSATATIDSNKVVLSNASVTNPVKVCYGFGKTPKSNLFNNDNLPTSEFMSDNIAWEGKKINQTLSFTEVLTIRCGAADFDAGAKSTSGLPITYESSNTAVATVTSKGLIHLTGSGTCKIKAYQAGDSIYRPSIALYLSMNVLKGYQTVQFDSIPVQTYGNDDVSLNASASSGLPIVFSSTNAAVVTVVSSSKIHIVGAGSCSIRAAQNGDIFYLGASISRPLVVNKAQLNVRPADTIRTTNSANPTFRLIYTGFVRNDSIGKLITKPIASCATDLLSLPGTYPITVVGGSDTNYGFTYENGTLTITNPMEVKSLVESGISISPNPIKNKIIVNMKLSGQEEFSIVNMQGSTIYSQKLKNDNSVIDINFLNPGIYLVRISDNQKVAIQKIIKL